MNNYYLLREDRAKLPILDLFQIHQARSQRWERLDELENLYKYVVHLMAGKEVLV